MDLVSPVKEMEHKNDCNILGNDSEDNENVETDECENKTRLIVDVALHIETKRGVGWRKMDRRQIMIIITIYIAYLLTYLTLSLQAPLFPKEANEKGVNSTTTGWIFGVFALVQFIISPFYRRLLPVLGCRSLLMLGMFFCGVGTISFGLLTYIDTANNIVLFVVLCFLVRIFLAVSCSLIINTGLVVLVQYFPKTVATLMGIGEIFTGVGLVGGPALGGLLYTKGGYILPFTLAGGMAILVVPLLWYFIPKENVTSNDDDSALPISKLLLHPVSIVNSIVLVITMIAWSVLEPTLEPHLREHGQTPETVGIMFLVIAAFYSITSPIWGRILDLIQEKRILNVAGAFLMGTGSFLLGPSPVLGISMKYDYVWYTAISLAIIGAASSMCVISTYCIYINVLRPIDFPQNNKSYGMVSGLWVSVCSLGNFIGPSIGGFLLDHIGFAWLNTWVAVVCLAACLLVCISLLAERKCCKKSSYFYRSTPGVTDDCSLHIPSDIEKTKKQKISSQTTPFNEY